MSRPARVAINLTALRHNLSRVRELSPRSRVMAVVKADAYGHGLQRAARALQAADSFGVACIDEAEQLRAAGITHPVVLLEGPYSAAELERVILQGFDIVVHHSGQIEMLEQNRNPARVRVWLKVDTGMHRLGFAPDAVPAVWQRLRACETVAEDITLVSHLADATDTGSDRVAEQVACFERAGTGLPGPRSLANSAGVLHWQQTHYDVVRPGLMLYGATPMDTGTAADHDLQPVMTLESELIAIQHLRRGAAVGYGASWTCPEDMPIGIVAVGYGDGFPRHATTGAPVSVSGVRSQVLGKASMDMLSIDLRPHAIARIGDPVQLWGEQVPVEEVARHAGTIPYELLCGVQPRLQVIEVHGTGDKVHGTADEP